MKNTIALASVIAAVLAVFDGPFGSMELPPVHATLTSESTPRTLDECFVVLAKKVPAETLRRMRVGSETDMMEYHHGLGTWIRNNWGLWSRGPLYSYFRRMGLEHPDDMSGVIFTSFWRYLHDRPLNVQGQVRKHQLYWYYAKHPDPLSNPRCSTGIEIMLSLGPNPADEPPRAVHMGKCCSDGQVWSYEADRGWYLPDPKQLAIWNEEPDERCDPCRRPACPYDEEGRRTRG